MPKLPLLLGNKREREKEREGPKRLTKSVIYRVFVKKHRKKIKFYMTLLLKAIYEV